MSKKSRKRNKKILAALALAGGAAMLAKGRGTPAAANVDSGRGSGLRSTVDSATDYITKKADVVPIVPPGSGGGGIHQGKPKKINPWRGVAPAPPGILNPYDPQRQGHGPRRFHKGGGIAKRGTGVALKKGGRVTGIAKRGFGRALMKGKK